MTTATSLPRSRTLLAAACALLIALLGACSQTPPPALPAAPGAAINAPASMMMGGSVTLDASGSTGEDLSFSWSFVSRPSGSGVALTSGGGATSGFTPDTAGTYVVEVEVSNAGGSDSTVAAIEVAYPDVSGSWNAIYTVPSSPPTALTLNLSQDSDGGISGTITDGVDFLPISGQLGPDGTTIEFDWGSGGTTITTTASFNASHTSMNGSFSANVPPPNSGSFSATKM